MVAFPKVKLPSFRRHSSGKGRASFEQLDDPQLDVAVAMVAASQRAQPTAAHAKRDEAARGASWEMDAASTLGAVSVSVRRSRDAEEEEVEAEFVTCNVEEDEEKENSKKPPTTRKAAPPPAAEEILRDLDSTPQRNTVARSNVTRAYDEAMASSKEKKQAPMEQVDSGRAFGGTRTGSEALNKERSSRKIKHEKKSNAVPKTIISEPSQPGFVVANGSGDSSLSGDTVIDDAPPAKRGLDHPLVEEVKSGESDVSSATRQQELHASAPPASNVAAAAAVAAAADDALQAADEEKKEEAEPEIAWAGVPDDVNKPFVPASDANTSGALQPLKARDSSNLVAGHDPVRLLLPFLVNYGQPPRPDQAWQYCRDAGGRMVICEQPVMYANQQTATLLSQLAMQPQISLQPCNAVPAVNMYYYT